MAEDKGGSLRLLLLVQLTQSFRGGVVSPIMALFIRGHGLSVAQIGMLGISGMLGWLIFEPLSGVVADRVRKKYMVMFAIITSTVIYALYPFASSIWHFALLAFSMASVMSAYAISVKAMTAELLPSSKRGKTYGRFLSVISMGGIIAPFVGGYITSAYSYSIPFFISAGIGVLGLIASSFINYDDRPSVGESSTSPIFGEGGLMTRPYASILTVRMIFMFNLLFRQHFLPIYLHESPNIQASETQIGTYMTIIRVTSALSQSVLGDLNDRVGSKRITVASVGLLGISYLGFIYASGFLHLYLLGAVQGILLAASNMSMMIHLMSIMPEGRTGMVMGIYSEAENVGGIVASPSLGLIYDGFSPVSCVQTVVLILISTAALAGVIMKKDEK